MPGANLSSLHGSPITWNNVVTERDKGSLEEVEGKEDFFQ